MDKYYGPDKVLRQIDSTATPLVELVLEQKTDGGSSSKRVMVSKLMLNSVLTDKPTDLTTLRDNRIRPMAEAILGQMLEWNLKVDEIDFLFTLIVTSFNDSLKVASEIVWGVNESDRTLRDVDNVLRKK